MAAMAVAAEAVAPVSVWVSVSLRVVTSFGVGVGVGLGSGGGGTFSGGGSGDAQWVRPYPLLPTIPIVVFEGGYGFTHARNEVRGFEWVSLLGLGLEVLFS